MNESGEIPSLPKLIAEKGDILVEAGIDQGRAEIEIALCHILDIDRLHLYLYGPILLKESVLNRLDKIIDRRVAREPLQYILGESWFFNRRFKVNPAVMIPTPETELLCESAIRFIRSDNRKACRILDVGVGSGVISVTMALEVPDCSVLSLDISEEAIAVARDNAVALAADDRIAFRQSDMLTSLDENEKFDLILSNPPYISEAEYKELPPEVLADPKIALTSGDEGMDAIRILLRDAPGHLAKGGRLMFEIGYNQAELVMEESAEIDTYNSIVILRDLNEIDRIAILSCGAD